MGNHARAAAAALTSRDASRFRWSVRRRSSLSTSAPAADMTCPASRRECCSPALALDWGCRRRLPNRSDTQDWQSVNRPARASFACACARWSSDRGPAPERRAGRGARRIGFANCVGCCYGETLLVVCSTPHTQSRRQRPRTCPAHAACKSAAWQFTRAAAPPRHAPNSRSCSGQQRHTWSRRRLAAARA